jgi:hypothetical protein
MKFHESPLLNFAFAFVTFERWLQNFSFFWTDAKFQNFALFDGESYKSQYHSYLLFNGAFLKHCIISVIWFSSKRHGAIGMSVRHSIRLKFWDSHESFKTCQQ